MTDRLIEDLKYWSLHESIPSNVQDLLMQAVLRLKDAADDQRALEAYEQRELEALRSAGVDNWEAFETAMKS